MQGVKSLQTDSAGNLVLDAGVVYVNEGEVSERLIGATRGGSTLNLGYDFRNIPVDGAISDFVKGFVRRSKINPELTVNFLEVTKQNWLDAVGGANAADFGSPTKTHDKITFGDIEDTDYLVNVTFMATVKGASELLMIKLLNVLGIPNMSLNFADKDELVTQATFRGHVTPANPHTPAVEIYIPVAAS